MTNFSGNFLTFRYVLRYAFLNRKQVALLVVLVTSSLFLIFCDEDEQIKKVIKERGKRKANEFAGKKSAKNIFRHMGTSRERKENM